MNTDSPALVSGLIRKKNTYGGVIPVLLVSALLMLSSCSFRGFVMDQLGDALTTGGSSLAFMSDDDPRLVGDALPFAIKFYESLLMENPDHEGLRLTTGSLYIMYANAFLQTPAGMLPPEDYDLSLEQLARAKNLYLRGRDIIGVELENRYPGILAAVQSSTGPGAFLEDMKPVDVPWIYWFSSGWFAAVSIDSFDMQLSFRLPAVLALLQRAYELNPDYGEGSLDELFISVYASIPESMGGSRDKAEEFYARALEIQGTGSTGPHMSLALSVALPTQDHRRFIQLMNLILEVPLDEYPERRLINSINQQQARWYLAHLEDFFLLPMEDDELF